MKKKLLFCLQSCPDLVKVNFARNTFLLISFFAISVFGFAQGPGHPSVDAGEDVVLECNETCTDLDASYLYTGDSSTYSVATIPYSPPFPFLGGTPVSVNQDDRWSPAITLPFDFCFYGQVYTQMVIGSNAVVSFDLNENQPNSYCSWSFDESIPDPALFHTAIFGPYMDIYPSTGDEGKINWTVFGEAPNRTMVVNFANIKYFQCTNLFLTSQIVMYETTNVVEIYVQNRPGGCSWNDGNAVIGIQNQDGTIGETAPGRNTGNWSATNEAWRFTPNGNTNVIFSWLDADGTLLSNDTTINVCPEEDVTTYTAQAVYTNCNGDVVTVTDEVQVTLSANFDVTVDLGSDLVFCDVPSYELVPEITGDIEGATFLWSPGGETTQNITITDSGTYTLEITKEGCTVSDSVMVTFLNSPDCTIEAVCELVDFAETFGSGPGRGESPYTNYTYKANGQIDDGEYALVSNSADLNTGWFTDMTDHTGDVDGRMMFVNASIEPDEFYRRSITLAPNVDYTFNAWITTVYDVNSTVCPGNGIPSNVIFRIEDLDGNTIAETNTGDIENGSVPRWLEYSIDFNSLNNTDVQLVLVNNSTGGCGNDLAIDDLTLRYGTTQPEIVTPPDMVTCAEAGTTTGIFNLETQIATILDGQNPGLFNVSFHTTELDAQANANPIANPTAYENITDPETIYVRVENVDQPSCFSVVSFQLILQETLGLTIDLPEDLTICSTDVFPELDATPTNEGLDLTLVTYEWKDSGNNVVSTDATYTPTAAGIYTVTVSYPPCDVETFTINVMVTDAPIVDLGPDKTICEGGSFEIIPVITGGNTGVTYLWSTGETTPTITVSESGVYTLEVSIGGCSDSDSIEIFLFDPVVVDLGEDFNSCFDEGTSLTAQVDDAENMTFEWLFNGVTIPEQTSQTLIITEEGEYTVIVTTPDGCTGQDSIVVGVRDNLEVTIDTGDFQTCPNQMHILTAVHSEEGATFQWFLNGSPIEGATSSTLEITIEPGLMGANTYTVVMSAGGCTGNASVDVTLYPIGNCVISQGITPNGDGYNDTLDLTFLNDRTGIKQLQIFNRYGTLVYDQVNYTNQWKGQTKDGKDLPTGTYFYVIDLAGNDEVYGQQHTGWIYLNQKG